MTRKFGQRMDDGGEVSVTTSSSTRRKNRENWRSGHDASKYASRYERLKERYPNYSGWGSAPTNKSGYKALMDGLRQWRKENAPQKASPPVPLTSWLQKNYGQIEGYLKDPSSFFSSELFKKLGPLAGEALERYRAYQAQSPAKTPSGVAPPGFQGNWAGTVNSYFPKTMKAGGLVRGGGAAQRGVGKGKMR